MTSSDRLTLADLRERFAESARSDLVAAALPERRPLREALQNAAAVLAAFDPTRLQPWPPLPHEPDAVYTQLLDNCDVLPARDLPRWVLRPPCRQEALRRLGGPPRWQSARAANPWQETEGTQAMLDRVLGEEAPDPAQCNAAEIEQLLTVLVWVGDAVRDLPEISRVHERAARLRLTSAFAELAARFQGRKAELKTLREYVGVLPAEDLLSNARRQITNWLRMDRRGPLLVHGIGGIGKTTLIAKFLVDHTDVPDSLRFPFVYIDFDSQRVRGNEPLTLLIEACGQLGAQYPDSKRDFDALAAKMSAAVFSRSQRAGFTQSNRTVLAEEASVGIERASWDSSFIVDFLSVLERADGGDPSGLFGRSKPLLMVLDTFEEVQYASQEHTSRLWDFFLGLQSYCPKLRVVASGRAPALSARALGDFKVEAVELEDLDAGAANSYLRSFGVESGLARQLVEEFRGNPLTLALVAEVLSRDESGDFSGIKRKSGWWSFGIDQSIVQGQLYSRVLGHVHDPEVRKLAHPGLVLRRIDPALIQEVLAVPCDVQVRDRAQAEALFEKLKREVSLVTPAADGSIRHRQDVRAVMLRLIQRERPDLARDINQRAARYYSQRGGVVERAEEIYHLLELEEAPEKIERRWVDGVEDYLRFPGTLDELPLASQAFLASRLGLPLPKGKARQLRLEDAERQTVVEVREAMAKGSYQSALKQLASFKKRSPTSPLHLLEAQAYMSLGDLPRADQALDRAIEAANAAGELATLLETALLGAEIATAHDKLAAAIEHLEKAVSIAEQIDNATRLLDARLRLLAAYCDALDRSQPVGLGEQEIRARMTAEFAAIPDSSLQLYPDLTRRVISHLGARDRQVFLRGLNAVGFGEASGELWEQLTGEVDRLVAEAGRDATTAYLLRDLPGPGLEKPHDLAGALLFTSTRRSGLDEHGLKIATALARDPGFRRSVSQMLAMSRAVKGRALS